jgi:signal peptidase I
MADVAKTEKTKAKRIVGISLNVVLWIFLVFALIMMIFAFASTSNEYGVSTLGDKVILNVKSESMEPVIRKGDMIVGTELSVDQKKELKKDDIISFFVDLDGDGVKELNTHRIVEDPLVNGKGEYIFYTKGDNNAAADTYDVRVDDIFCTWKEGDTQIHGLGSVLGFFQSRLGFLLFVILPLTALFIYEIVRLVMMISKIKSQDKKDITDAEKEEIRRIAIEEYKRSLADGKSDDDKKDGPVTE